MRINRIQKILKASRIVLLIGVGLLLIFLTNPQKLPSVLLIAPFVLMFVVIYWITIEVLHFWHREKTVNSESVDTVHPRRIALLVAATPTILLVLQSVGQLTVRDFMTVLVIFVLACFYLMRLSIIPK